MTNRKCGGWKHTQWQFKETSTPTVELHQLRVGMRSYMACRMRRASDTEKEWGAYRFPHCWNAATPLGVLTLPPHQWALQIVCPGPVHIGRLPILASRSLHTSTAASHTHTHTHTNTHKQMHTRTNTHLPVTLVLRIQDWEKFVFLQCNCMMKLGMYSLNAFSKIGIL